MTVAVGMSITSMGAFPAENPETVPSSQGEEMREEEENPPLLHVVLKDHPEPKAEKFVDVAKAVLARPHTPLTVDEEFPTPVVFAGEIVAFLFQKSAV